jgi:hypothetical protein
VVSHSDALDLKAAFFDATTGAEINCCVVVVAFHDSRLMHILSDPDV